MKLILTGLLIMFSLSVNADEQDSSSWTNNIIQNCIGNKEQNLELCQHLQVIEKNIQFKSQQLINNYNLKYPSSVLAFVVKPEISFKKAQHQLKIKPKSISYSYEF